MSAKQGGKGCADFAKFLPIVFICLLVITIYAIFMILHIMRLLQIDVSDERKDYGAVTKGYIEMSFLHFFFVMFIINYVLTIVVKPGSIPETVEWHFPPLDKTRFHENVTLPLHETKNTGERRHCKWCTKYKPDRAHHCRVCRMCILKMDHHCPWVHNCIGFRNHKFFYLVLFWSVLLSHFVSWSMFETVAKSVDEDTPFGVMFTLIFGETLTIFLAIIVTAFFGFHTWLLMKAMTTIEFCEKASKRGRQAFNYSLYNRGVYQNMKDGLGPLWMWLIPIHPPDLGTGLLWVTEHSRLTPDIETGGDKFFSKQEIYRRQQMAIDEPEAAGREYN